MSLHATVPPCLWSRSSTMYLAAFLSLVSVIGGGVPPPVWGPIHIRVSPVSSTDSPFQNGRLRPPDSLFEHDPFFRVVSFHGPLRSPFFNKQRSASVQSIHILAFPLPLNRATTPSPPNLTHSRRLIPITDGATDVTTQKPSGIPDIAAAATTSSLTKPSGIPAIAAAATTSSLTKPSGIPAIAAAATTFSPTKPSGIPATSAAATTSSLTKPSGIPAIAAAATTSSPTNHNSQTPPATASIETPKCNYCLRPSCRPTAVSHPNFNAKQDSDMLTTAIHGPGKDEGKAVRLLTSRSEAQVQEIVSEYAKKGRSLSGDISSDQSLKFKTLLHALVTPLPRFYAEQLQKALEDEDTNTLLEITTSLSDCAIEEMHYAYGEKYKESLAEDIKRGTAFSFEKFILGLTNGNRGKNQVPDIASAIKDADSLIKAGVNKRFGSDKNVFIDILTTRSFPQLREVLKQYDDIRKPHEGSIESDIKKKFSGKLEQGLKSLVINIKDQPSFFADELNKALEYRDNGKLIRILRGRFSIDLREVQETYDNNYPQPLLKRISQYKHLSPEYRQALLALIDPK